jgi:Fur family peroxide stress response transcriptional regulator
MDTTPAAIAARLAVFRRRCADLRLALTPQRLAIYEFLAGNDAHPSAEEIFQQVKPDLPSLSLGTVYRTLELFEAHGLVSRVLTLSQQARFDANQDEHHHFICLRCQRVLDSQDPRLRQLPVCDAAPDGFRVLSHRVQVLGLCQDCQRQS